MPRQLPWLNNGGGARTQTKQPSRSRARTKTSSDIDDDFFDGTILASSSKGKGKAAQDDDDSEDDLPDQPSAARTGSSRTRNTSRSERAQSSSPPPIADDIQPQIEFMRKGVSKFDLRDDEWMMVEDEFLETAKLFTRHLHIAEYEKLKERIEAKKKEQVQATRPVVSAGKLSIEKTMKKKAEVQVKRQQNAIRDVFASQDDEDEEDSAATSAVRIATSTLKRPPLPATSHDSDSEDLDASHSADKQTTSRPTIGKPTPSSALPRTTDPKSASSADPRHKPASITPSFAKPALPASRPRGIARKGRFSVDMLDDYVPPTNRMSSTNEGKTQPTSSPARSSVPAPLKTIYPSSSAKPAAVPVEKKTLNDDGWGSGLSKATAERIAKRKAEREKEREIKKKSVKLEDIPTFLV